MITKLEVLNAMYPSAKWVLRGNELEWLDSIQTEPTEEEIQVKIAELTAAEPLRLLREQRNQLLSATDWWVLPDRTVTQAQLDYRQALRDLPTNSPNAALDEQCNLINVTWPTKPEA
jgi:hypothetical protein